MQHNTIFPKTQRAHRRQFKVVLLGDSTVGKTSIIQQFVHGKFDIKEQPTIGIDFLSKIVTVRGKECRLQLWDSAGQEKYMSLVAAYIRDADCALFVFDLNNPSTLQNLQRWIRIFMDNNNKLCLSYLCGNKSDLNKYILSNINKDTLNRLINTYKMSYHTLSALTTQNLHEIFSLLATSLIAKHEQESKIHLNHLLNQDIQTQPTEGGMLESRSAKLSELDDKKKKQKEEAKCFC